MGKTETMFRGSFDRGIVTDTARHIVPPGGVVDAVDYLFDKPGVAYKRGGSAFQSEELDGEALMIAVAAPEFPGSPRVIGIASDGGERTLYDLTGDEAETGVGCNDAQPTENPPLYIDRLILCDGIGDGSGTYADVQKVYLDSDDVTVDDLGGGPPNARCSWIHNERLVLANTVDHPNYAYYNPTGPTDVDIEDTWNLDDAYIPFDGPVVGGASVQGLQVVWTRGSCTRVLGSTPPGAVGENMDVQPMGKVGCIDARSIVQMNGEVYWANETGVYRTNGAAPVSITSLRDGSGIGSLWAAAMSGFAPALGAVVSAGVWLNKWLLITVLHASSSPQSGATYQFLWYEPTGAWHVLSDGVRADMYATRYAPDGEIYAASCDAAAPVRLLRLSSIFVPTGGNMTDANGGDIEPLLELTPGDAGVLKKIGEGRVTHLLEGAAGDSWEAETVYAEGDVIYENGVYWQASGGTSAAVEPDWDTAPDSGDTVTDDAEGE